MTEISPILPETPVLLANAINGVGVVGLIVSHFLVARSQMKRGFIFSLAGGALVATGSALLLSWPVVVLNVAWALIALIGFLKAKPSESHQSKPSSKLSLSLIFAYTLIFFYYGTFIQYLGHESGGWYATAFYLSGFLLLSMNLIQSRHYLYICLLGFFMLFPHLFVTQNYAVLTNETIGALIGIWGIGLYYWNKFFVPKDPITAI